MAVKPFQMIPVCNGVCSSSDVQAGRLNVQVVMGKGMAKAADQLRLSAIQPQALLAGLLKFVGPVSRVQFRQAPEAAQMPLGGRRSSRMRPSPSSMITIQVVFSGLAFFGLEPG